ncbi:MAG: tRNA uridine-5-carboxymethylaminomethyl(34) synthesis GTPase MnmE [Candidatus Neomarinimicrobiota bacterium]
MVCSSQNTIVALATPLGISGLAVIRISGQKSLNVAHQMAGLPKERFQPRYSLFCSLRNRDGQEIDHGLITFFKGPQSYTGEDVVEISCHGGTVIPQRIVETCLQFGCHPAGPGEFTRRAFLNGKMDLSQAEAVSDVIAAKTALGQKVSYRILSGKFSSLIHALKEELLHGVVLVEGELDFAADEVPPSTQKDKERVLSSVIETGKALLETYQTGRLLTHGAIVSIIGKPNVGKSTLLNALIAEERVIVSDAPGTTRDAVEVLYQIQGFPISFIDTAGLGRSHNPAEKRGIEFSREYIRKSDLVLWVFDSSDHNESWSRAVKHPFFEAPFLTVLNKADLLEGIFPASGPDGGDATPLFVSALKGQGLDQLTQRIFRTLVSSDPSDEEVLLTNARHKEALEACMDCVASANARLAEGREAEIVAFELREALSHLDRILGVTTAQDILDNIFSTFCVGK